MKSGSNIDDYFAQKFTYFGQVEAYSNVYLNSKIVGKFPGLRAPCTACDFRNACCYEHTESMLYRVF